MKSNTITTILNIVLAVSLLLSVVFCLQFIFLTRKVRSYSYQVKAINAYRTGVQALVNDCMAYSQKNPDINPILESAGVRAKAPAPTKQPGTR